MPISAEVVNGTVPTSGQSLTRDYTVSDFGDVSAAMVVFTKSDTEHANQSDSAFSCGYVDGDDNNAVTAVFAKDNVSTDDCRVNVTDTEVLMLLDEDSPVASATGAVITDGIRLTFSATFDAAYSVSVVLFRGAVGAAAGTVALLNDTDTVVTVGFETRVLLTAFPGATGEATQALKLALGVGHFDENGILNRRLTIGGYAQSSTNANSLYRTNRITGECWDDAQRYTMDWIEADDTTFTMVDQGNPANKRMAYLALGTYEPHLISLDSYNVPASTGETTNTIGFKPGSYLAFGTVTPDTSLKGTGADLLGMCVGAHSPSANFCAGFTCEDDADPSSTSSYFSNTNPIRLVGGDQAISYEAEHTTNTNDGYTLDFTTANDQSLYFVLSFREYIEPTGGDGLITAMVNGVTPTGTESLTVDYRSSGFGTPDAAIVFMSRAAGSAETVATPGLISVGLMTSSNQACCAAFSDTGGTNGRRYQDLASVLADHNTALLAEGVGSFITDGVRITYDTALAGNYPVSVMLIKGATAELVSTVPNVGSGTKVVTGVGFEADLLIFVTNNQVPGISSPCSQSFGVAHKDSAGTITQWGTGFSARSSSQSQTRIEDTGVTPELSGFSTYSSSATVSDINSDGFDLTITNDAGSDRYIYLALKTSDPDAISVGVYDTPTSTGQQGYTTGINTKSLLCVAMPNDTVNAQEVALPEAMGVSYGGVDSNAVFARGIFDEDDSNPAVSGCYFSNDSPLYLRPGDGNEMYIADLVGFSSTGFALNFTTVDATARKFGVLAFGETVRPVDVMPAVGGTGRVARGQSRALTGVDFPWWEEFEEPQPKEGPPEPPRDPTLSEQLAEIAGELDMSAEDLRTPQEVKTSVTLSGLISGSAESRVEYNQDITINSDLGFKVNVLHEQWSDVAWSMRESIAAQNRQIMAMLMSKLLD